MAKYKLFCYGLEHIYECKTSLDYEYFSDYLLDLLDVCPQMTIINCDFDPQTLPSNFDDAVFKRDACNDN